MGIQIDWFYYTIVINSSFKKFKNIILFAYSLEFAIIDVGFSIVKHKKL